MVIGNVLCGFFWILQWFFVGLMFIIGLVVGIFGVKLVFVGGILYFVLMGVVMVIVVVLIFCNCCGGILLYVVVFIVLVIWVISDVGWNYWLFFLCLFVFGVLVFLVVLVWFFFVSLLVKKGLVYGVVVVFVVVLVVSFGWMFKFVLLVSVIEVVLVKFVVSGEQQKNWVYWGNIIYGDCFVVFD